LTREEESMCVTPAERLILQSIVESQGDYGRPVSDFIISHDTSLKLEDVRNILQMLQENEMVSLVFTERGLVTFIEAKGRLELSQSYAALEPRRRSSRSTTITVSVAGLTGTGKSLLINRLIGDNIMNVVSIFPGTIEIQRYQAKINNRKVELTDCPGLGSGQKSDTLYFAMYKEMAAASDIVLWTVRADTKVVSLDERYFEDLRHVASEHKTKILIALTYCDRIEPGNWDSTNQCPD
jgi:predicted GTPase